MGSNACEFPPIAPLSGTRRGRRGQPRHGMRKSSRGKLHGTIPINTGGLSAGGLWAIEFGVGGSNRSPDVLYFADGINSEMDGLFGAITAH